MGLKTQRPKLKLSKSEIDILQQKSNSRTLSKQEVQRSRILLLYHQNMSISEIERQVGISRPSIYKCIDKALAGGIKIDEPAVDLAVCCSIASSLLNKPSKLNTIVIGEVGLGGEVRSVGNLDKRIQEAEKMAFTNIIVPKNNMKTIRKSDGMEIIPVDNIKEAIDIVLQ